MSNFDMRESKLLSDDPFLKLDATLVVVHGMLTVDRRELTECASSSSIRRDAKFTVNNDELNESSFPPCLVLQIIGCNSHSDTRWSFVVAAAVWK